jgi:hypothetical protein
VRFGLYQCVRDMIKWNGLVSRCYRQSVHVERSTLKTQGLRKLPVSDGDCISFRFRTPSIPFVWTWCVSLSRSVSPLVIVTGRLYTLQCSDSFEIDVVRHTVEYEHKGLRCQTQPYKLKQKRCFFGAAVASSLQIHKPTFLTDSFLLAKAAAIQRPTFDHLN